MGYSYTQIRDGIHDAILRGIDFSRSVEDGEVLGLIDEEIVRAKREQDLPLQDMKRMRQELFNAIRRLDVLQELVESTGPTVFLLNAQGRSPGRTGLLYPGRSLRTLSSFYLETTYHYFAYHYLLQKAFFTRKTMISMFF